MESSFPHPVNPKSNPKIVALIGLHGAIGYGLYWSVIEMLLAEPAGRLQLKPWLYSALTSLMNLPKEYDMEGFVSDCINTVELFATDGDYFWDETIQPAAFKKKPAARVATIKSNPEIQKKWAELEKILPANITERWVIIKTFITDEKPDFIEPYATAWNIFASSQKLAQIEAINETRKKKFATRIKDELFSFYAILEVIKKDEFYRGLKQGQDWKVTWDHIFENEMNYLKILEKRK